VCVCMCVRGCGCVLTVLLVPPVKITTCGGRGRGGGERERERERTIERVFVCDCVWDIHVCGLHMCFRCVFHPMCLTRLVHVCAAYV